MVGFDSITVTCPDCNTPIVFDVAVMLGDRRGDGSVGVDIGVDRDPITAHVDQQHQAKEA
jgi:hypothetical protein